jgi:hypothetical protein
MADSNMTIGTELAETTSGRKSRLRKVTFTHTAAGTADGNATTTFNITGTLLRIVTDSGGDASWNFVLNDGIADVYTSPAMGTGAQTIALGLCYDGSTPNAATDAAMWGIPLVDQTLLCTTSNMSGTGTGPVITVIWEESPTI